MLPFDYAERVYAGVLGKIIGVYVGRPFEQQSHESIVERFGEIDRYVASEAGVPLVVTDDDISGTFAFLRAIRENEYAEFVTSRMIGETWRNQIIEERTILWWGGRGMSTEHTAFFNLKEMDAPESGSISRNGRTVSEQIGAQIFIDGWGLIHPNDPERAAAQAAEAARVSHDGEAVYGAMTVAAMVAAAFSESDPIRLLDLGTSVIPKDSLIAQVHRDVRAWAKESNWRDGLHRIREEYGYQRYGGGCHMVPNHALIVHALAHCGGDFGEGMRIVNTCGYDTDCNSANVGCILGVANGLEGFEGGYDWRGPIADRALIPTAEPGECVTDAVRIAMDIVESAHRMRGLPFAPVAKFSFAFPGSVQGFEGDVVAVSEGIRVDGLASTAIAPSADERKMAGYRVIASPSLYPGQTVTVKQDGNLRIQVQSTDGAVAASEPGATRWRVPDIGTIERIGVVGSGTLRSLDWDGSPEVSFDPRRIEDWIDAADAWHRWGDRSVFNISQNQGVYGMLLSGAREWRSYFLEAEVVLRTPCRAGIGVGIQGQRLGTAFFIDAEHCVSLRSLRDDELLQWQKAPIELDQPYRLRLVLRNTECVASLDGVEVFRHRAATSHGGVALTTSPGRAEFRNVRVGAVEPEA